MKRWDFHFIVRVLTFSNAPGFKCNIFLVYNLCVLLGIFAEQNGFGLGFLGL